MFTLKIVQGNYEIAAWDIQAVGAKFLYGPVPQSIKDYALEHGHKLMFVVLQVPSSEELYTRVRSLAYGGNEVANELVDKWEESWTATLKLHTPQSQELAKLLLEREAYANVQKIGGHLAHCSVSTDTVIQLIAALNLLD